MPKSGTQVEKIIQKIKKDLVRKNLYKTGSIITGNENFSKEDRPIIENEIEKGLITARNYANPTTFLPMNPYTRVIKKLILSIIRVYTKSQIVFNQNVLYSANKLYQYLLHIYDELKDDNLQNQQKIRELEKRINVLEKKLKK